MQMLRFPKRATENQSVAANAVTEAAIHGDRVPILEMLNDHVKHMSSFDLAPTTPVVADEAVGVRHAHGA